MASDEVRLYGVRIGRLTTSTKRDRSGRVSVVIGFKRDHVGMMHAAARSLDEDRDR